MKQRVKATVRPVVGLRDAKDAGQRIDQPVSRSRETRVERPSASVVSPEWVESTLPSAGSALYLLIVTSMFRPIIGGVTTYVSALEKGLRREDLHLRVLAYPTPFIRREAVRKTRFRKLLHIAFATYCLLWVVAWRLLGRRVVVHSHGASFCLLVAFFARQLGAVGIHTFHSPLASGSLTLRWFAPHLDALIYVSAATKQMYESTLGIAHGRSAIAPGAVDVTSPNPRDRGRLRQKVRVQHGWPANSCLVVFVGRMVPEKGPDVLLSAFCEVLARAKREALLFMVGPARDGPEGSAFVESLARLASKAGMSDRITFMGRVSEADLEDIYLAADFVVVPSRWQEPAPMVIAEAMAHALPVIGSRVGGLSERIQEGQTGLLFDPENVDDLAKRILELLENPEICSKMGFAAGEWAQGNLALQQFAAFHVRFYRNALERLGPSG